jgi:hypothetical protein
MRNKILIYLILSAVVTGLTPTIASAASIVGWGSPPEPRTLYVDDNADGDPGPSDPAVSDPLEDGTQAHPFDAIQEAIDTAWNSETILVLDGTYTGGGNRDIDFKGKAIMVRSENGPENCIIHSQGVHVSCQDPYGAEGHHRGFYFHSGETQGSTVSGFTITGGCKLYGGGIHCYRASPTIINNRIIGNTTSFESCGGLGGGIYCYESSPMITNCTISRNWAGALGGGVCLYNNSCATIINCTITNNWVSRPAYSGYGDEDTAGGGISCYNSSPKIINCTIAGNGCEWGSGVYCLISSVSLLNCTIWGNRGRYGGGLCCHTGSDLTLTNCIVADNLVDRTASAIYGGPVILRNCIMWDNIGGSRVPGWIAGSVEASYSCIQGGWSGEGNINQDPQFVCPGVIDFTRAVTLYFGGFAREMPDFIVEMPDYHLQPGSPCIDAGDNTVVPAGITTDLDGNPRFVDDPNTLDKGKGTPPIVDMGAYERAQGPLIGVCGDSGHPYPKGDLNQDCLVDFADFAEFADNWLVCTAPKCD